MLNKATIQGRFVADPEIKKTGSGVAVTSFTLASDTGFKDSNGDAIVNFVDCVAWRKSAENICRFFEKGRLIIVEGEVTTRLYEDKNKKRCKSTEISVEKFHFCDSKKNGNESAASDADDSSYSSDSFVPCDDEDLPF